MVSFWEGPETRFCEVVRQVVDIDGLGVGCAAGTLASMSRLDRITPIP